MMLDLLVREASKQGSWSISQIATVFALPPSRCLQVIIVNRFSSSDNLIVERTVLQNLVEI